VLVNRQQDMEVFDQLFSALFRNPELAQQLLAQQSPVILQLDLQLPLHSPYLILLSLAQLAIVLNVHKTILHQSC
jgi:hypothetical protein